MAINMVVGKKCKVCMDVIDYGSYMTDDERCSPNCIFELTEDK